MHKHSFLPFALLLSLSGGLLTFAAEPAEGEKLFALKLKRLFAEKCISCHGADPDDIAGSFDMRSREAMLRGGDTFEDKVLIASDGTGNGDESYLYAAVARTEEGYEMPPKEAEKLTEEETWWVRDWINAGAPWPDDERVAELQQQYAEGVQVPTSGGLSDDWTNRRYNPEHLWAYQPLQVTEPPPGKHPIDWFIDRQLEERGIEAAEDATPSELVRRISFGLTGLPPRFEAEYPQAQQFVERFPKDPTSAIQEYSDHLLQTPHYGEHFGQHWLDVARYADTAGFANDYSRPNAWRYRDYVIRSFNKDKPFDEFIREQIAGDEIDAQSAEKRIATGFLRMGPWEQTGMSVFRITRQQWLDDVTDSVGQAFLGHALQCAKCHDHKFDPVPTRDYYSMMAVFSTTQFAEVDTPFLDEENLTGFKDINAWTKKKISQYEKQKRDLQADVKKRQKKESGDAKVGDNGLDPGDENSIARMSKNISRHRWELEKTQPIAFTVYTGKTIERKNVSARIQPPAKPWVKGTLEEDTILTGGDAYSRGDAVTPGPISAATKLGEMTAKSFPAARGKRRLALANWIVDKQNPLTARVIVNRVWTWHFGRGIAGNPNNIGATGKLPTHPKLLDYLADWFIKNDWSIKGLNRLIVTSKAYRRSSRGEIFEETEPEEAFSSHAAFQPRRLTAEEFRDAMLSISGELNRQIGGVPCRPDINMEVAFQPRQIMGGAASVYEPDSQPEQRNRRTIYAEKIRGLRDPFMETFNQPGPDKSCELRETSTVAPQALTLFNAVEVQDRALAFANRLLKEQIEDSEIIKSAFLAATARQPTASELATCLAHWKQATAEENRKSYQPAEFPDSIDRTVVAEKSGEPYTFTEFMPAYENYVPDLQPSDVDARTRGLAQVCLVLLNLNEFAYVD